MISWWKQFWLPPPNLCLVAAFAAGDLGSLNSAHLGDPSRRRLDLAHGADLVAGVSGDTNVVAALEGELDVTDLEDLGAALFGVLASGVENLVDEAVCYCKDGLRCMLAKFCL